MNEKIAREVQEARRAAEGEMGFTVSDEFADRILELCKRKCLCAGKDEDYLPIMYRFELPMKVKAEALNEYSRVMQQIKKGAEMYVQCLSPNALPSAMPVCT